MAKYSRKFLATGVVISGFLLGGGVSEEFGSEARGALSNVSCDANFGIVNNELDAGVNVVADITNVGEDGPIKITSRLSSSEGEWSRTQTLTLARNQTMHLTYFFAEPSINATNVQCWVAATPNAG